LVMGNTQAESDKTFFVNLTSLGNAVIGKGKGTGTILNDDGVASAQIEFSQSNYQVQEDLGAITLTVNRTGDTSSVVSVDYKSVDGSGTQKADFEYAAGTRTPAPWGPGQAGT